MTTTDYIALRDEQLDELVHDAKGAEAAEINNGGREAQIAYLSDTSIASATPTDLFSRRKNVAVLLAVCQAVQTKLWDACSELEAELGGDADTLELAVIDLENYDVDSLIAEWDEKNAEEERDGIEEEE